MDDANSLAFRLRKTFENLMVVVEQDAETRGAFEVTLNDEQLLHSKLTRANFGDARCETEEEVAYLVAKICAALVIV